MAKALTKTHTATILTGYSELLRAVRSVRMDPPPATRHAVKSKAESVVKYHVVKVARPAILGCTQ
jgi:hypothetical protein